jgi:hypothetical protein
MTAASTEASTPPGTALRIRSAMPGPRSTTTLAPSSVTSLVSAAEASAITRCPAARAICTA